jgi:ABC-type multidrug transport system permease subunit
MTTLAHRLHRPVPRQGAARRPSRPRLLGEELQYAVRDLWRSRIASIFTFLLPLTFLVVMGAMAGNETIRPGSPVRVMQFATPAAAAMGALYGSFPTVAASLAEARELGILKRVRGTPLPRGIYLAGRIGAAALFALGSLVLLLAVGVVVYDVQLWWARIPAMLVTVLMAVTCFAALGVAVAGVVRSAALAQSAAIAAALVLSFLSGLMGVGTMPVWANAVAGIFPVKPLKDALELQLDPWAAGNGWDLSALAMLLAWTLAAVAVAARTFRWEPVRDHSRRSAAATNAAATNAAAAGADASAMAVRSVQALDAGRPRSLALLLAQARWGTRSALRDTGWVFFAIAMPWGLYVFNAAIRGAYVNDEQPPLALQAATGMVAWGAIVAAMVNLPEAVARARETGLLKRLRGTPLQTVVYLGGRFTAMFGLVAATAVLVIGTGIAWFDVDVAWRGTALAAGVLLLGTASLAACGTVLVSLLPSAKAVTAVGLGIALPLGFFSDTFAVQGIPAWMQQVGDFFPLKPLANSLSFALDPAGPSVSWVGLAVMSAWLVVAGVLALRTFRWSSRG